MTWRPSEVRTALGERLPTAVMVAEAAADPASVVVTAGVNDTAVFRFSPDGVTYTEWVVTVPATPAAPLSPTMAGELRDYRDGVMAALAVDTSKLPFEFTAIGGRTAALFYGARRGTLTYYSGTADYLGFVPGQSVPVSSVENTDSILSLQERVVALESGGGGGGGGGTVALGGAQCWYASPTGTTVSGTLGYASGNGVAAISPLFVDQELSFSKMQFEIWTSYVSSQTYTCLLYDTADGYPNLLLAKADIATGTSGGSKEATITPITLLPGTYWIGAWVGNVEPATGALVNNVGVGIMMAHGPSGAGKTGNQRVAAGWKTTNLANPAVGSTWPGRAASGMGTDYRVPRVALWAG